MHSVFLAHMIRLDAEQVLRLVRGTTVFHLYATDMKNFVLSFPEVNEQAAICRVLRDAQDELDALSSRLHKTLAIKQGMMQKLLPGRTRLGVAEAAA